LKIIGICGQKRHGKDTVGSMLQGEQRGTPIAFADPIKRIAMDLYGFSYAQCYGDEKEIPDPRWDGLTARHALQQIGTEMGRSIHPETWIRYCLKTIERVSKGENLEIHWAAAQGFVPAREAYLGRGTHDLIPPDLTRWCITDVRFPNEAQCIRAAGGMILKVVRPSLVGTQGDTHASETSVDQIKPDHTLINDGTVEDLREKVLRFLET